MTSKGKATGKVKAPRIAILAWGSLIWNPGILKYRKRWYRSGPSLPIEFSRLSRGGRLTLVIDPTDGSEVVVRYSFSTCATVTDAVANLNDREGRPGSGKIGVVRINPPGETSPFALESHPLACNAIREWAVTRKMDAVIWTALEPNFKARRKELQPNLSDEQIAFTKENAVNLLLEYQEAIEYVQKAPLEVVTPVRTFWRQKLAEHSTKRRS